MTATLTVLEQAIAERIQQDFPLCADPYGELARQRGCSREEAHAAVRHLRELGVIRRIGGSYAATALGYVSTLVAARVAPAQLAEVAECVNRYPEVTHNYERDAEYNLWFTVIAATPERQHAVLQEIGGLAGVLTLQALPAGRTFKIKVDFPATGGSDALGTD